MAKRTKLQAPKNLKYNFKPSPKQYELWRTLQPECHICGGEIEKYVRGYDKNNNELYGFRCSHCGNEDIPQMILGGGSAGGGKMLNFNSFLCTPTGFKPLKDVKVGDMITNPMTGGMQKVMYIHPMGEFEFYKINFCDGTSTECSEGHIWKGHESRKTNNRKGLSKNNNDIDSLFPAQYIYEWYEKKKEGMYKGQNIIIPLTKPVQFAISNPSYRKSLIDPYILGVLLGDGCITEHSIKNGVSFTSADPEIPERVKSKGGVLNNPMSYKDRKALNYYIKNESIVAGLKKLKLAGARSETKFIPETYKYSTIDERIELMKGLMDTDGYVDPRGHCSYTTISKSLAEDVAFIVRSLGCKATVTVNPSGYKNERGEFIECKEHYDVVFNGEITPELVSLKRKKDYLEEYKFNGGFSTLGKRIESVEKIGKQKSFCITVSQPHGLYVTDNFTVTHNSYLGCNWLIANSIRFPNFRSVLARKTLKILKETTLVTFFKVLGEMGLEEDVHYSYDAVNSEIEFWNKSVVLLKELTPSPSDPTWSRLGGLEIGAVFLDESDELQESAVDVLFSRIRWMTWETLKVPKMLLTCNPNLTWIRNRFVIDENGNDVVTKKGEYYVPFSLFDNPDPSFRATYESSLSKLPVQERNRLLYGDWRFVKSSDLVCYKEFDNRKHLVDNLLEDKYDPDKPLIISFDFNTYPFMSSIFIQMDYNLKKVYVLKELLGYPKNKEASTPALSRAINKELLLLDHQGGVVISGDPAGKQKSTLVEDGVNNFTIVKSNISNFSPSERILSKSPSQAKRVEWINEILGRNFDGWSIEIDSRCFKLIEDLVYQKKNPDGTKDKTKIFNVKDNIRYEPFGHLNDCLELALTTFINDSYSKFLKAGISPDQMVSTSRIQPVWNY